MNELNLYAFALAKKRHYDICVLAATNALNKLIIIQK